MASGRFWVGISWLRRFFEVKTDSSIDPYDGRCFMLARDVASKPGRAMDALTLERDAARRTSWAKKVRIFKTMVIMHRW